MEINGFDFAWILFPQAKFIYVATIWSMFTYPRTFSYRNDSYPPKTTSAPQPTMLMKHIHILMGDQTGGLYNRTFPPILMIINDDNDDSNENETIGVGFPTAINFYFITILDSKLICLIS